MPSLIEATILRLLAEGGGKSVTPEAVARDVDSQTTPDPTGASSVKDWRARLPQVRAAAVELAQAGRLLILRHGRSVDEPAAFKGVYRLKLPYDTGVQDDL